MSFNDCPSPDTPRSLTGPDILHRHSINSLLEQQEIINRGFVSPTEGESFFFVMFPPKGKGDFFLNSNFT